VRRRTNGTVDRHFLWDGDNLLAELNGAATERIGEYVHWGLDQPLAILTGAFTVGAVDYHVQDALGNVKLLFNQTPGAPIDFQTEYSDWGTPVNTTWGVIANRLLFKGMFYEGDSTKLYYARNRWYSPEFGGFMSEDPLSIGGGLNTYAFAGGDPINGSDPTGLIPKYVGGRAAGISEFSFLLGNLGRSFLRHDPPARPSASMADVHSDPFGVGADLAQGIIPYASRARAHLRSTGAVGYHEPGIESGGLGPLELLPIGGVAAMTLRTGERYLGTTGIRIIPHGVRNIASRPLTDEMMETVFTKGQRYFDTEFNTIAHVLENFPKPGRSVTVWYDAIDDAITSALYSRRNPIRPWYVRLP
jgi:RHS repeat-associated protein